MEGQGGRELRVQFVVQSFIVGRKGNASPGEQVLTESEAHALRLAERMACSRAGVVAFKRCGSAVSGEFEGAAIIATYGLVPAEVAECKASS